MKDYFNSQERDEFLTFVKSLDHGCRIEQSWGSRKNLSKEELKSLRMCLTWGKKVVNSIINRQNETSRKAILKTMTNSSIALDYKSSLQELLKKRCSLIDAAYEENRDYFALVELIMHYNCRDCKKKCTECAIYNEFEERNIPELQDGNDSGNCKYSYTF